MNKFNQKNLLKKIKNGDESSFGKVYDFYVDKIYQFVFLKVNHKENAQEIVQDVFWKFWQYVHKPEAQINNISSLLYTIARNLVFDFYRSQGRDARVTIPIESQDMIDSLVQDNSLEKEAEIDIKYDIEAVQKALEILPDSYQDIIVLKYINELSNKEIGIILNKKEGAVRVNCHRALLALKQAIKKQDLDR